MDAPPPPAFRPRPSAMSLVLAAAGTVIALWFITKTITAILLFFFALVVAIALSAPVRWLQRRGISKRWSPPLVLLGFFACVGLVSWLVIPELAGQIVVLVNGLPDLIRRVDTQLAGLLFRYPELHGLFSSEGGSGLAGLGGSASSLFRGVGNFSLSLVGVIALTIIFLSTVIYIVLDPVPVLRGYIGSLPPHYRRSGVAAYRRASLAVVGWTKASLIVGTICFVAVFIFLSLMSVPAALVWATLAFFSEFIPRIGGYVMAFPPVVVALTISPMTALWTALFYLALTEFLGDVVAPRIRGETMQIHPALLIFFTLAFTLAFGILGAVVATPAAAFFSAFYSEFYIKRRRRPALQP
jgi:predicted PurR-regulated permease PerM